jgi:hypothetical protein
MTFGLSNANVWHTAKSRDTVTSGGLWFLERDALQVGSSDDGAVSYNNRAQGSRYEHAASNAVQQTAQIGRYLG